MYYVRKRVVVSYSGGKDSALAMYRAVQLGYEPVCILTTYNSEAGRSWFHVLPTEILEQIAETLDVSLELVKTGSVIRTGDYGILPVYDDIIADKVRDAAEAFVKFRENHQI